MSPNGMNFLYLFLLHLWPFFYDLQKKEMVSSPPLKELMFKHLLH